MPSTTVIFPVSQYNPKFYCLGIQQEHAPLSLFSRNFYALLCPRSKVLIWGFLPIPHHTDRSLVRCKIMRYMRGDQTGKKPCITIKRPPIVEQRVIRSGPYFRDLRPQKHSWSLLYNNSTNTVSNLWISISRFHQTFGWPPYFSLMRHEKWRQTSNRPPFMSQSSRTET